MEWDGKVMGNKVHHSREKHFKRYSLTLGVPAAIASFRMEFLLPKEKRMGSEPRKHCSGHCGELLEGISNSKELFHPGEKWGVSL